MILVLLEGGYLLLANLVLQSSWIDDWLQRRPRKVQVVWQEAWSWWPGQLQVEGLELRRASTRSTWQLDVDDAEVRFALLPLLRRRLHIRSLDGDGYAFLLRQEETSPMVAALQPPVPPLYEVGDGEVGDGEVDPHEEQQVATPGSQNRRQRWPVEVDHLHLRQLKELWLGAYHLVGSVEIEGGLSAIPGGELEVLPSRLVLDDARLFFDERPLAEELELTLDIAFAPFLPREHRGKASLAFASGRLQVDGRFAGLGLLDDYLRAYPWLRVASSGGYLTGELGFAAGHVIEGSRLQMGDTPLELTFYGGQARGSAEILAEVRAQPDNLEYVLEFRIHQAEAGAVDDDVIVAKIPLLVLTASDSAFHLVDGFRDPSLEVELPQANFLDLSFLDEHLPPTADLTIRGGRGQVALHVEATSSSLAGSPSLERPPSLEGHLRVEGQDLQLDYRNQPFAATVVFDANLEGGDLQEGRFDLGATTLDLESATRWDDSEEAPQGPWRGRLELADGSLRVIEPWHLRGDLELQLTDTSPLFALYLHESRLLKHFRRALTIRDVHGTAGLRAGRRHLGLSDIDLSCEHLQLLAQLDLTEAPPDGLLWAKFHGLSAGLEIDAGKKDIQLIRPRRWYNRQLEVWQQQDETSH